MRKTKALIVIATVSATLLLGGCGDSLYEMTEEEESIIVNYSAHILSKYNANQKDGLIYVNLEGTEETEEEESEEEVVSEENMEEDTTEQVEDASVAEVEDVMEEEEIPMATLQEVFPVDGIELDYVGTRISAGYVENSYYAVDPDVGNAYLVVGIDMTNTTDSAIEVDLLSMTPRFRITLNDEISSSSEMTILTEDFSTYTGTIEAGGTAETVLLFQIPETVTSVDSLRMDVSVGGETYQINLDTIEN